MATFSFSPEQVAAYNQQAGTNFDRNAFLGIKTPPFRPSWNQGLAIAPYAQQQFAPASQAVAAYRAEAMRPAGTPSPWAGIAGREQLLRAQIAKERLARDLAGSQATATSQLAMRGGMTGGARERLAREGQRGFMGLSQDVGRQTQENLLKIQMADEQARQQLLGNLPRTEMLVPQQMLGARQFDIGQETGAGQEINQWNANLYNQAMRARAAENIAFAQREAASRNWFESLFG